MDESSDKHLKAQAALTSGGLNLDEDPLSRDEPTHAQSQDPRGSGEFSAWTRLGFLIPAAPWPVLLWIKSYGYQAVRPHGAEALYFVGSQAMVVIVVCTLVGVVCHIVDYRDLGWFLSVLMLLAAHFYAMYWFVDNYAVAYA